MVRRIFDLFTKQNLSIRGIRALLNKDGIKGCFGGQWGDSSVAKVLNNETYMGKWYFNRRVHKTRTTVEYRDRKDWITIETTPLIELRVWKAAQKKLLEHRTNKRCDPKHFYLLGGMVFCSRCQRVYGSQTSLKGRGKIKRLVGSYRHRVGEGHCLNRGISAKKLEARVWDEVRKAILDPVHLREGYEGQREVQEKEMAQQQEHLRTLHESIIKLASKRDNLTKAYIDPEIKMLKLEYVTQRDAIEAEINDLKQQIAVNEEHYLDLPTAQDWESLEALAVEMRWLFEQDADPTPEEKRRLMQMLHVKVWINLEGESKVTGWYTPKEADIIYNKYMVGPPGSGKTLMARALPSILPQMSIDEALDVTRIYSVADMLPSGKPLIRQRPFRRRITPSAMPA